MEIPQHSFSAHIIAHWGLHQLRGIPSQAARPESQISQIRGVFVVHVRQKTTQVTGVPRPMADSHDSRWDR